MSGPDIDDDLDEDEQAAVEEFERAKAEKAWREMSAHIKGPARSFDEIGPAQRSVAHEMAKPRPERTITHSVRRTPFKLKRSRFPRCNEWAGRGLRIRWGLDEQA